MKEKIKSALTEKAGGTFLYVSLVLHDLKKATITSQVIQKLKELPSDLNKMYDRILSNVDVDCVEVAKFILRWVAVARRPLTIDEFAMARAFGTGVWEKNTMPPEDVLDEMKDGYKCCEPLVYMDAAANTINLVHQSAKDYLVGIYLQTNVDLSQYHIVLDRANLLIFRTCWKYLSLEEFRQATVIIERRDDRLYRNYLIERLPDTYYFLQYAAEEWQEHAQAAISFLATDEAFWKEDLCKMPTLRDYWLIRAAAAGHEEVVQPLLENGAIPGSIDRYSTLLLWAAMNGHQAVVKLLLDRDDVAVNILDPYGDTPLLCAVKKGHEAVIKLLLDRDDVMINLQNRYGESSLSLAAQNGNEAVVKLLLNREDGIADSRDIRGQTPLSWAARKGREAVVKLLLNRNDVAVNSKDMENRTPLLWAAGMGHEAVVKLLLDRNDVTVEHQDPYIETPLSWASKNGHKAVVKLLLSRDDIDADSQDINGHTPLSWAAGRGYKTVVEQLLERNDVAVDSKDEDDRTPLSLAAERGRKAVVKLLLDRNDVAIDSKDKGGRTPLWWATQGGHEPVVKLLEQEMRDMGCAPPSRKRKRSE